MVFAQKYFFRFKPRVYIFVALQHDASIKTFRETFPKGTQSLLGVLGTNVQLQYNSSSNNTYEPGCVGVYNTYEPGCVGVYNTYEPGCVGVYNTYEPGCVGVYNDTLEKEDKKW